VLSDILELAGHRVHTAGCGAEAIALLERVLSEGGGVDVVLVDLVMPDMDGLDCIAALRARLPGLPALLCTGLDRDGRLEDLPPDTRTQVLRKPMPVDGLLAAVRAAVEG
jgi:CheY-like chemotaxis protein